MTKRFANLIQPSWPAPDNVIAFSSTRLGGKSRGPYNGLNLAKHVGDNDVDVEINRYQLPYANQLNWLQQVHGSDVIYVSQNNTTVATADGSWTDQKLCGCCVLSADCLPVLITNQKGSVVAAVHCGWRGLAKGILENTVHCLNSEPKDLLVWLGPAIGPLAFEVGEDVVCAFSKAEQAAFAQAKHREGKYDCNLYQLATLKLEALGVHGIYGGEYCTYSQDDLFYSYRRDGITGRIATCIMIE